mgnify:FL=1
MVVATVLTVYGIETEKNKLASDAPFLVVATVLTVYGIETDKNATTCEWNTLELQQYLPFTVLKHLEI